MLAGALCKVFSFSPCHTHKNPRETSMDTLVYAPSVSLDDKYRVEEGQVFITGVQALVRLPLLRREIDAKNGLNTAGFISGYRGSPLGTYDKQLWQERKRL